MLQVPNCIVTPKWVHDNLYDKNLIILDGTLTKVGTEGSYQKTTHIIPNTRFFDLKNVFRDTSSNLPNSILDVVEFQESAREIGINHDSCIVVYDSFDIYSSPRVWWMFRFFGFTNIAVLDGGLKNWIKNGYRVVDSYSPTLNKGNATFSRNHKLVKYQSQIEENLESQHSLLVDARASNRFLGEVAEPRDGLRSGHIPNSINIPYPTVLENNRFKSKEELAVIFKDLNVKESIVFSCGSGLTACILALAYHLTQKENYSIYDGSWTEWGSNSNLPIA